MRIQTLFKYLIGNREAIHEIAGNRWSLLYGGLFVLSAGLAREYDGQDLVHESWYLLGPYFVSLLASSLLYTFIYTMAAFKDADLLPFFSGYRRFLAVFWMTAPLAWLYAIPYERFLSEYGATQANLCTLGLVACWRVLLMVRVVCVLFSFRMWQALCLVMLLADVEALIAMLAVPFDIIDVMGGVRLSDAEALQKKVTADVLVLAVLSLPVWVIGAMVAAKSSKPRWELNSPISNVTARFTPHLACVAIISVLFWLPILPFTQREQMLRRHLEHLLIAGEYAEAFDQMSRHELSDFPPQWNPPPLMTRINDRWKIIDVWKVLVAAERPDWICLIYERKLASFMYNEFAAGDENAQEVLGFLEGGKKP